MPLMLSLMLYTEALSPPCFYLIFPYFYMKGLCVSPLSYSTALGTRVQLVVYHDP